MESNLVIKVKYGDTLRRFSGRINENGQLDLDLAGLREKIFSLYSFPSDAELILTYIDEDGDAVTLADDSDLHDVMRQDLKFLMVNVQLDNDQSSKSSARSSGSSTPLRSTHVQHPLQNVDTALSEILRSVPEPLLDAISKLSIASKASSSNQMLTELVDYLSKVGQSFLDATARTQVGNDPSSQGGSSEARVTPLVPSDQNLSSDCGVSHILPQSTSADSARKGGQETSAGSMARGVEAQAIPQPATVDLNLESSADFDPSGFAGVKWNPALSNVVAGDGKNNDNGVDGRSKKKVVGFHVFDDNTQRNAPDPFSGVSLYDDSPVPPYAHSGHWSHHMPFGGMSGIFHRGVQCDGCGVHPITGPRFKSKVKQDYDLCSICFSKMGNEADYIRMDRPVSFRHARFMKKIGGGPALPNICRNRGMKLGRPKFDSRFILDVNILDGTVMAPSTPFTKIWRMRNNGNVPWPNRSQLVWIGGDKFSDAVSVDMEIPTEGVPIDGELDIAVDFTAPELPGRYISYWRMASPSGIKFGQRVWVLIQVDASLEDSISGTLQGLNLNLPPASSGLRDFVDMDSGSAVDVTVPITLVVDQHSNKEHIPDYRINNDLLLVDGVPVSMRAPMLTPSAPAPPNALLTSLTQKAPSSVPPQAQTASAFVETPFTSDSVLPSSSAHAPPKDPLPSSVSYPIIDQDILIPPALSSLSQKAPSSVPPQAKTASVFAETPFTSVSVLPSSSAHAPPKDPLPSSVSYPIIDLDFLIPSELSLPASGEDFLAGSTQPPAIPPKGMPGSSQDIGESHVLEETLLKELAEMGFKQVDLNKEVLRLNKYDLEKTVEDLCGVTEWDPILEELQEMGFRDAEMNMKLLKKNNGSIKGVVMDLLAGEKA
ncbi:hypothetical protein SLE2022_293160 [Rubroshorea leprosula]